MFLYRPNCFKKNSYSYEQKKVILLDNNSIDQCLFLLENQVLYQVSFYIENTIMNEVLASFLSLFTNNYKITEARNPDAEPLKPASSIQMIRNLTSSKRNLGKILTHSLNCPNLKYFALTIY